MSDHTVKVVKVHKLPHPNADALSIVRVGGWQAIVRTADWEDGALGAYIPPDSILPEGLMPDLPRRVRAVRLRGEVSEGLLVPAPEGAAEGDDVMEQLGVTHYEPVPEELGVDEAPASSGYTFGKYDLENARASAAGWEIGDQLVVTEKIHGENWRATFDGERFHVGSRTRWKHPSAKAWWGVLTAGVKNVLRAYPGATLYGEVYGSVGGFPYDTAPGERKLRVFDLRQADGTWLPNRELQATCGYFAVETVPLVAYVKWDGDLAKLAELAEGKTLLGGHHVREGVVVRPTGYAGSDGTTRRPVRKIIGRGYLTRKEK